MSVDDMERNYYIKELHVQYTLVNGPFIVLFIVNNLQVDRLDMKKSNDNITSCV